MLNINFKGYGPMLGPPYRSIVAPPFSGGHSGNGFNGQQPQANGDVLMPTELGNPLLYLSCRSFVFFSSLITDGNNRNWWYFIPESSRWKFL
jgi:hypothetical protein